MRSRTRTSEAHSAKLGNLNSSQFPIDFLISAFKDFKIGIAVVDRQLRFKAINCVLAEMNKLPTAAHIGKPLHEILGPLIAKVAPPLEQVFTTGRPLPKVELSGILPTRPDPVNWIQCFFPLVNNRGRVVEIGAFVIEGKSSPTHLASPDPVQRATNAEAFYDSNRAPHLGANHDSDFTGACHPGLILSGREREVLRLLATGNSNKEISSALAISVKTVETYRSRVMLKTHAPSLTHLVHYAIRHQIVKVQG